MAEGDGANGRPTRIQTPTIPTRTILASINPLPIPSTIHALFERRNRRARIHARLEVRTGISGREDDLPRVGPRDEEEVIDHLTAEGDPDPFVGGGGDDFADEFCGLGGGGGGGEDEAVGDVVRGFLEALEGDSGVGVGGGGNGGPGGAAITMEARRWRRPCKSDGEECEESTVTTGLNREPILNNVKRRKR